MLMAELLDLPPGTAMPQTKLARLRAQATRRPSAPPPRARVLMIEGEPIARSVLRELLTVSGFEVQTAAHGDEALAVSVHFQPQIVITDWLLAGGISGFAVANALVSHSPDLHAIFITELPHCCLCVDSDTIRLKSYQILHKPVEFDRLETVLREASPKPRPKSAH